MESSNLAPIRLLECCHLLPFAHQGPEGNRSPRGEPGPGGGPMSDPKPEQRFETLMQECHEYPREAYAFLFDALDHSVRHVHGIENYEPILTDDRHHVGAHQLLESVRRYAILEYGCLTSCVFASWGIHDTEDIGKMVYQLIDYQLLGKRDSDRLDDFVGGFGGMTFEHVFAIEPQLEYCQEKDQWTASYRSAS